MFDLRYHVASLAAVFFALVIGILVGVALAGEFVSGGDMPLWDALDQQLVETRVGTKRPADAVVVVRTADPQTQRASAQIVSGLFAGLADAGMPAVGVESRGAFPSAVK